MSSARAEAAERVRANQDEASTTSHASSSRAGITSSSTSNRATLKPLSLADALARAGGDATRALDEVLAERNQLCLEANRLQTENMRIWNLMRRPKRDPNEAQTAASRTSHEGNSPGPGAVAVAGPSSSSRGSPLAAPPLSSSRRRGAGEVDSASPSSDGLRERGTPDQDLMSQAQSSSSTSSQPVFAQGGGGTALTPAPAAAASSTDRGTGSATESTLAPTARSVAGAGAAGAGAAGAGAAAGAAAAATSTAAADLRSGDLSQQSSIMQQRAAAQLAARAQSEGHGRRMSFESQDYEAVDGSSAAPSDDEAPQSSFSRSDATAAAAAADETIGPRSSVREPSEASTVAPRSLPSSDSPANTIQRPPPRSQHQQHQQQQPGEVPTSPTRNTFAHHQAGNGSTSSLSNTARTFPPSPMAANFARSARTMSVESLGGSAPRLDASRLANARLSVAGSNLRSNERGREVISFYIAIDVGAVPSKASSSRGGNVSPSHPQSWRVEKLYSDVLALDARLKQKHGKTAAKRIGSAQLPDRTLFKDHAPSKVDQRKAILDAYLQNLLAISLPDKDDLCTFLCTDVVPTKLRDPQAMTKEGFLTKKGQNMGRWVTRLYRLSGNKLDYYESRGGAHLGSIAVTGAQIGRQQRSATAELDENSYRHAFLILEKRPPSSAAEQPQMVRHVLCAESDDERDEWVDILVRTIAELEKETGQTAALPPSSPTKALSQSRPSAAVKNSGMSISTSSSTTLVQPPNPRSPTRARAEDVSHKHSGSQTGSFGRGSEPALMPASSLSAAAARRYAPQSTHQPPSSGGDTVLPSSSASFGTGTEMGRSFSDSLQYGSNESMLPSSPPQQQIALAQAQAHQPALISSTSRGQQRKASQDTYVSAIAPGNTHDSRSAHHATSYDTQRPSTPENKSTATMSGGGAPGGSASKGSSSGNNSSGHGSSGPLRPSISGPMNGAPIPTGFKFGGKDEGGASSSSSSTAIGTASNGAVSSTGVGTAAAPSSEGNKKRFWQRFAGGGGGSGGSADKNAPPKKVFGVPLAESIAASNISEGLELPSVVYRCIEYLEKRNAASEEGIYRLSGSSAVIKSLKDRFNAQGDVDLLAPTEPMHDPHAVAGLLKTFFRELPSSVLTSELHLDFMRANDILDRKERVNELGQLVSMLPLPNYSVLRTLCSHLIKIIERQDENKMTMRNVGIVFSPTLGIPAGVFALFLTEFDWVFYTDARGEPAPRLIEEDIIPPDNEELGKESFSSHRSQGREGSVDGSEHFADALSQDFHQSSAESTAGAAAPSTPRARSKKGNRTSWIAGNALHAADGQVHDLGTATSSSRHNRNSLSYNEEEADKLLGGPQGRNRLSSHVEEIDQVDLTGDAADDTLEDEAGGGGGGGGAQQQLQSPVGDEALHATPAAQLHQRQQQEWAAKASFESLQPPSSAMAGVGSGGGTYSYIPSPMASPRYASSTKSARSREPSASQHDHTLQLPGTSYDQYGRPQAWSSASSSVPASPAGSTRSHRSAPRPPMPSQPSPASSAHHYPQQYGGGGNPRSPPPVS